MRQSEGWLACNRRHLYDFEVRRLHLRKTVKVFVIPPIVGRAPPMYIDNRCRPTLDGGFARGPVGLTRKRVEWRL
jgi:hypothetical protein